MRWVAAAACAVLVSGCVSLTPEAERVRVVHDGADVAGCTLLRNITAPMRGGYASVVRELRNETAARGGDTLLMLSRLYGEGAAYRCVTH